jgi:LPXTG-motif cell wall-anchored protein
MKLFNTAPTILCMALVGAAVAPGVKADDWDKKTTVTFSGPVEIPGVHLKGWAILPAGTYVFKLLNSNSDRHIVQIFNQEETTIYATILAIPNYRLQATDKTVITFSERPEGQPEALRAWFYPGTTSGEEFVYPKARALELAKAGNVPVLFTVAEIPAEVTEPMQPNAPVVATLQAAPVMAVQPTGEEVQPAPVAAPVAPAETLPTTGSNAPLFGLIGLVAVGAALGAGLLAKRLQ